MIDIFLYSHHLPAWYCIDIVRRNSVLVTCGSERVKHSITFTCYHETCCYIEVLRINRWNKETRFSYEVLSLITWYGVKQRRRINFVWHSTHLLSAVVGKSSCFHMRDFNFDSRFRLKLEPVFVSGVLLVIQAILYQQAETGTVSTECIPWCAVSNKEKIHSDNSPSLQTCQVRITNTMEYAIFTIQTILIFLQSTTL